MTGEIPNAPATSRKRIWSGKWLLLSVAACGLGFLTFTLWPEGLLDLSKEEEPFRSMVLPMKGVKAQYGSDENSVLVGFTDSNDHEFKIWFRTDGSFGNRYPTAVQIENPKLGDDVILENAVRSRALAARLMREHGDLGGQNAGALEILGSNLFLRRVKRLFW